MLFRSVPGPINFYETEEAGVESSVRDEIDIQRRKSVSIKRLASLNKPELPVLLVGSIAAAVHGVTFPMFGLIFSSAIKSFFEPPSQLLKDARVWALCYVGMGFVTLLVGPLQNYFFGVAGGKLIQRIRSLTFEKVVHQNISWFDDPANSRYFKQPTNFLMLEILAAITSLLNFSVVPLERGCLLMHLL